jgi:hypothetical protein
MKKVLTIFLTAIIYSMNAQSYQILVTESRESIGAGSNNAFTVLVYEADYEDVEKEWKKQIKEFKSEKTELSKHTFFADNLAIPQMGTGTMDMYTNFAYNKDNRSTKMVIACDLGVGYLNSTDHREKYEIMKKIIYDFAVRVTKEAITEQLKTVNKALDRLNDKQKELEGDKKNMDDRIANDKEKIKKAEEDIRKNEESISKNLKEQEEQKKLIENQKKVVEEIKRKFDTVR